MNSEQLDGLSSADFITGSHRISGQVQTGAKPLSDVLNDPSQSYMRVLNVYISRLDEAGEIGAHAPVAYLSKDTLCLVIVPAQETRIRERGLFSAYQYENILITISGFEVRGTLVGSQRINLRSFSPTNLDSFVVMAEATAQAIGIEDLAFQGEAILVNRAQMESLCLAE